MADRSSADQLQPALLDRLTDLEPDKATESRDRRVIDIRRLREIVRRDLAWLLNTNNLDTLLDDKRYPNVQASVLNYGVREVSGDFSTEDRALQMKASIQRSIELFEPRIAKGTLEVVLRREEQTRQSTIVFDIHGVMWAEPMPIELYLRSEVDLTSGHLNLRQQG